MALLSRSILTFTFLCPYDSSVDALCVGGGGFTNCCSLAEFPQKIPSFVLTVDFLDFLSHRPWMVRF